jgi:hypothetical protein
MDRRRVIQTPLVQDLHRLTLQPEMSTNIAATKSAIPFALFKYDTAQKTALTNINDW